MKKGILLLVFTCFSFIANAQTKVGTIDADYILNRMPGMKEVNKGLETYNTELQGDLKNAINQYETLIKEYEAERETLSDSIRAKKENNILGLENDIKNFRQRAQLMMQMRQNELSKPLYEKIDAAMKKVIEEEGFTQIIHANGNSLAFASAEFDITEKVMLKLGIDPEANSNLNEDLIDSETTEEEPQQN